MDFPFPLSWIRTARTRRRCVSIRNKTPRCPMPFAALVPPRVRLPCSRILPPRFPRPLASRSHSLRETQNQLGFFEFVVLPFYSTVSKVAPELSFLFKLANDNYKCWKDLQAKGVLKLKDCRQAFVGRRDGGGKRAPSGI